MDVRLGTWHVYTTEDLQVLLTEKRSPPSLFTAEVSQFCKNARPSVMRNGAYIRALGRMSFEPSIFSQPPPEPDAAEQDNESAPNSENSSPSGSSSNPHPPWTELQSELASAQNDVLVTVGLCLRETHPRPKEEKTGLLMKENEVGLIVGALDLTAAYLGGWSLINMRSRIQVCLPLGLIRLDEC